MTHKNENIIWGKNRALEGLHKREYDIISMCGAVIPKENERR